MADPYKVLGIGSSASDEEVTQAYRKLAKKYHPDLNPNSASAEDNMRRINAAYDQIQNERSGRAVFGGSPSGGSAPGGTTAPGGPGPGDPFGGQGQQRRQRQQEHFTRLTEVRLSLAHGQYQRAFDLLAAIPERTAEWYYCSAQANAGLGNRTTALNHARTAVRLQPENPEYQSLLRRFEQGVFRYRRTSRELGFDARWVGGAALAVLLANFFCIICCRPC